MLKKRIIPCLDVHNGRTVKGINFINLRDAGDPVELGTLYARSGADELVYLDISATNEGRKTFVHLVDRIAEHIDIPFTVGGGIADIETVNSLLQAGADKIGINSAAVKNPQLINDLAAEFGSQCVVVAIDARKTDKGWFVHTHGGRKSTELEFFSWASEVEDRGAGEILFTSMDHDGTKNGFAIPELKKLQEDLHIPIIASGGAGNIQHFTDVFQQTDVSAALAASIFHFREIGINELKEELKNQGLPIR